MCALLYTTLFSTLAAAILSTLCVPYSTLPYSLLWLRPFSLLYVRLTLHDPILYSTLCGLTLHDPILYSTLCGLTLHDPILGCGHTLSLRQCGDCLICVFLILYLYNVISGDCDPHFVFTSRILRVTWVS